MASFSFHDVFQCWIQIMKKLEKQKKKKKSYSLKYILSRHLCGSLLWLTIYIISCESLKEAGMIDLSASDV